MRTNLDYFKAAIGHREPIIDPDYHRLVEKKVIPDDRNVQNALTCSNGKVIQYVTAIATLLNDLGHPIDGADIRELIDRIVSELETEGMNYSALCQYFNVHNMNYSLFMKKGREEKVEILKFILRHYISDRHPAYLSHGYSDIVLQVMCDNYSHKRKGSYGARKIACALEARGLVDLAREPEPDLSRARYYLLADKTGKKLFRQFARDRGIRLSTEGLTTEKFPDALIKVDSEFFVIEQKNMKEDGGGQDKQAREITDFICRPPEFDGLHYVTYMDGVYVNTLSGHSGHKKRQQYDDIVQSLTRYPANYFVNEFAFNELMHDVMEGGFGK